ncbi:MAG: DUF2812 domain-containing protein [Suipraeoptans sp.]
MNETKRMFRIFTIADYDKEESFLSQQHNEGYKLISYTFPGIYTFEACTPENYIYQLDLYQAKKGERDLYTQMFIDAGWDYVFDAMGFSYFRKRVSDDTASPMIFNDRESKLDMVIRIITHRLFPILALFLICIIPQLHNIYNSEGNITPFFVLFIVLLVIDSLLLIHCTIGLIRLRKNLSIE